MSAEAEVSKFDVQTTAVRGLNPIADNNASWNKKMIIKTLCNIDPTQEDKEMWAKRIEAAKVESESIAEIEELRIDLGNEEIEVEDPKADKPLKNITEKNIGEQGVVEGLETINLEGETVKRADKTKKIDKKAKVLSLIEDHLTTVNAIEYEQGIAAPSDVTLRWKINEHIQACAAAREVITYFESEIGGPG